MKTRIKALECIKSATNAETKDLVLLKKDVINGLVPALDDHKRLVRQAATSARNSSIWLFCICVPCCMAPRLTDEVIFEAT